MENKSATEAEIKCADCEEILTAEEKTWDYHNADGEVICSGCVEHYGCCERCGRVIHSDDLLRDNGGDYYCEPCRDNGHGDWDSEEEDGDNNLDEKEVKMTRKYQSKEPGKIIKSERGFAVEVECYCKNYYDNNQLVLQKLPKELGVSSDGSLNSRGVEFQTPILKGKAGEDMLKGFCNTLVRNNYSVDKSCGLHIHLDGGRDFANNISASRRLGNIKRLFTAYYFLDGVLAMYLPLSRRRNCYCRPLGNDYHLAEIENVYIMEAFEKIWYREDNLDKIDEIKKHKSHDSRYHGVNIHCLLWQNHLEIRYHSGTIDKNKILFWTALNQAIMDYAVNGNFSSGELQKIQAMIEPSEKRKAMYKLLGLEGEIIGYLEARAKKFCIAELTSDTNENK